MSETIVLSLGGSLIVPKDVDSRFLKQFKKTILKYVKKGFRFVIICGGGFTARQYQQGLVAANSATTAEQDWVGISATYLNAFLMTLVFKGTADPNIISDPTKKVTFKHPVRICSGWKPGWSTDFVATLLGKQLKTEFVVNMSNIEYVYSADPKKVKSAERLTDLTWAEYRKISGSTWSAGLSLPFDPIAAKEAQKNKQTVYVIGRQLSNFEHILQGKNFIGSVIHP